MDHDYHWSHDAGNTSHNTHFLYSFLQQEVSQNSTRQIQQTCKLVTKAFKQYLLFIRNQQWNELRQSAFTWLLYSVHQVGLQELLEHIHKQQNWQPLHQSLPSWKNSKPNINNSHVLIISVTYIFSRERQSCTYWWSCPPTKVALVSKYNHQLLHNSKDTDFQLPKSKMYNKSITWQLIK